MPRLFTGEDQIEGGQRLVDVGHVGLCQPQPALGESPAVAPGRHTHHQLGVVDAVDGAIGHAGDQRLDGDAGAEADLQHPVGGANGELVDGPAVALHVGAPGRHDPADGAAEQTGRTMELTDKAQPPSDGLEPLDDTPTEACKGFHRARGNLFKYT
jgi:hypothetical protein